MSRRDVTRPRVASSRKPRIDAWLPATDLRPDSYVWTRWLYLRLLGITALCAFWSMAEQMDGLFLSQGILPADGFMAQVRNYADGQGWGAFARALQLPTLAWWSASDGALHAMAFAGIGAAILLIVDVAPGPMIACLWVLYLSLVKVGGVFFHFQWDTLLLETLLCSLFVAPWRVRPRPSDEAPPGAGLWLLRLLLFKLMFLSGVVKLMAHDDTWTALRALDVHFFTQPLPTWTAYYAHFAPHVLHVLALLVTFAVELVLPFLVFGPRRIRAVFGAGTMLLMVMIGLTGNYGFFNLLTFSIAVMCFDDALLGHVLPARWHGALPVGGRETTSDDRRRTGVAIWVTASLILWLSALQMIQRMSPRTDFGRSLTSLVGPFLSINSYGLFQDMTTTRPEIIIEGSRDGREFESYEFRYKPGALDRRPRFAGPFMPRLDWQMWFAALSGCEGNFWFYAFSQKLLAASPQVLDLLASAPFGPGHPPRYIRTTLYDYTFAPPETSDWWRRADPRPYCPVLTTRGQ